MSSPPMKSQPLHNFSLSSLKWARKKLLFSSSTATLNRQPSPTHDSPDHPNLLMPSPAREVSVDEEKGWKLRPRKEVLIKPAACSKNKILASDDSKHKNRCNGGEVIKEKSQRLRGLVEGGQANGSHGVERKQKMKFWISLSREEIEEDVYALTGGKPARRPRKLPKSVQKQLDNVFPGLYLDGATANSFRVHDVTKGA